MTLLQRFADPNIVQSMTFGEKMLASTYVAILGMGITFLALVILWVAIVFMTKILRGVDEKANAAKVVKQAPVAEPIAIEAIDESDDLELIAIITAAIASATNQPLNQIFVRNIRRTNDNSPVWQKTGLAQRVSRRM
jgi:sodium pump decarboxylase gamma subunit